MRSVDSFTVEKTSGDPSLKGQKIKIQGVLGSPQNLPFPLRTWLLCLDFWLETMATLLKN